MKKLLFAVAAIVIFLPVRGQFRYGLQGGVNLATLIAKNYNNSFAHNLFRPGFNASPFVEYACWDYLSLKSALILETKGTNATYHSDTLKANGSTNLLYLDIPLLAKGNFKVGVFTVFVDAGPYAGIGLTGRGKLVTPYSNISRKIRWGKDYQDDFKRFDYGVMGGAGVQWNNVSLEATFVYGLANIYPLSQIGYIIEHRVVCLKVGYFFGSK